MFASDVKLAMTEEQFDELVNRLEGEARCKPSAYRFKVYLLALLGNVYVSFILLILLALVAALSVLFVKLQSGTILVDAMAIIVAFLYLLLRCLRVRIEPPEGIEISAGQAPELFAIISQLRSRLGAPRFDHVLITDELNASIQQLPRLGIFGWPRNYLIIGMPLMKSLTGEQFKAVLAHEFGHLAKGHGIVSHSIYRQRLRWSRLMTVLEVSKSKGRFLFMPFLKWFVPYFGAFSFPLARADEYEADAISVQLTSSRTAAEALTNMEVVGGYLTDLYWPRIDAEFGEKPQPSRKPYSEMSDAFATRLDRATAQIWLGPAIARQTTSEDTHPALKERLAAINEEPSFSPPELGQAADTLLGSCLEVTTDALDRRWKENLLSAWELRHEEIQGGRCRFEELNEKHANGVHLNLRERRERAELTESIGRDFNAALDQWRALQESVPDDASICLALGSRLIMRNDNTGCDLVKRALQSDENAFLQGCELLCHYYSRNGHEEEYHAWNGLWIEEAELRRDDYKDRNGVSPTDEFEPHGLPEDTLAALVAQLRAIPNLSTAYFMKKRVLFPHRPLYVLGYTVCLSGSKPATEVFEGIRGSVQFPGDTFIINVEGQKSRLRRKFGQMRWAKILNRNSGTRLARTVIEKMLAMVVILSGIFLFLICVNNIFRFTSLLPTGESGLGINIGFLLFSIMMITAGTWWWIDSTE